LKDALESDLWGFEHGLSSEMVMLEVLESAWSLLDKVACSVRS